ncbi:MAG: hypothetical protein SOW55_07115 [Bacilli bacterium]|nr:hypothetical protein [Bacilli bacterium]
MKRSIIIMIICILSSLLYYKIIDSKAYMDIYNKINEVSFQIENNLYEKGIILESTRALLTKYQIEYISFSKLVKGEKFSYSLKSNYFSSLKNQSEEVIIEYEFIYY